MTLRFAMMTIGLVALSLCTDAAAESQRQMHAEARIKEADARKVVLEEVPPRSVVQSVGLEREGGRLIWSYDILVPSSKSVTEVQVDAITGVVVDKHVETVKEEAAEAAADRR